MSADLTVGSGSIAIALAFLHDERHDAEFHAGKADVDVETLDRKFHREEQERAEERAESEAEKSSFWGDVLDIAKDVGVIGAVAASACTGGSSLVVAGALIGGGLTVGGDIARRAGADKDLCQGMELAGSVVSLATGGASLLSTSTKELSELQVAGSAIGKSVSAGATGVEAGATYAQKKAQSDEVVEHADAKSAKNQAEASTSAIDDAIARMQQLLRNKRMTDRAEADLQRTESDAMQSLINRM
jgi:hypothetical protein